MAKKLKSSTPSESPKKPQPSRAREVTALQLRYVKGLVSGQTKEKAKREAGYSKNTKAKTIESRPAVKELFTAVMHKAGISDELLARRIREGLDATVVARETKYSRREVLVDYSERREYSEFIAKLNGYVVDKHEIRDKTLEDILEASNG